jgi:hypothetical protein
MFFLSALSLLCRHGLSVIFVISVMEMGEVLIKKGCASKLQSTDAPTLSASSPP